MSTSLSFKALRAQLEETAGGRQPLSDSQMRVAKARFVLSAKEISQPVGVARVLTKFGLPLRKAHDALNRLAKSEIVTVELDAGQLEAIIRDLAVLGVTAAAPAPKTVGTQERYRVG